MQNNKKMKHVTSCTTCVHVYYMYVGIVVYIYIYVPGTFMSCMNYVCSTMYLPLCTTVMYDRSNRECVHAYSIFVFSDRIHFQ